MSTIPLPALSIRPPDQQQQDPLQNYGRLLQLKNMMQNQPLEQQLLQNQVSTSGAQAQEAQLQLKDRQAMTDAMKQWDGRDLNSLPDLMLKSGASANAVMGLKSQLLDYNTKLQTLANSKETGAKEQLENEATKNDFIAGQIGNVKQLPIDQQAQGFETAKAALIQKGYLDPARAQQLQYQGPDQLDNLEKSYMGHNAAIEEALKQTEGAKNIAQAGEAISRAGEADSQKALTQIKLNIAQNSKPGDFDKQIDAITGSNGSLNLRTKAMVNYALSKGDIEQANKAVDAAASEVGGLEKEKFVQGHEDFRQTLNRQAVTATELQKSGLTQLDHMFADPQHGYTQFLAQAQETKNAVSQAQNGNQLAASLAPLMTALGVTSFAGIHRINTTEINSAGPKVGSIFRRINAGLDKAAEGKLAPATANEMSSLVDGLIDSKYGALVNSAAMVAGNGQLDPQKTIVMDREGNAVPLSKAMGMKAQKQSAPAAESPSPQNSTFSLGAWQKANPKGDPEAAKRAAVAQGYAVTK